MFYVNSFHQTVDRMTFTLNQPKDGCDRIVCNARDDRFGDLILRLFETGRAFDFEIDAMQGPGVCTVRGVAVSFSGAASTDVEAPNPNFTTFLSSWRMQSHRHYFATASPETASGFVWLTLPVNDNLFTIVHSAFMNGRMLKVTAGFPFVNSVDNRKAATILDAEMIWQGLSTEA